MWNIYCFILLGITEYIIYRSFIRTLKHTGVGDADNSTLSGIRHTIRWHTAIDVKQLLKSIIIIIAISAGMYRFILYDDYSVCVILAAVLVILNISDISTLYKNISAVVIYVNVLFNISVIVKAVWSIRRNSTLYTSATVSLYIIPFVIFASAVILLAFIKYNDYRKINACRIT